MFTHARLSLIITLLAFSIGPGIADAASISASSSPSPQMLDGLAPEAVMALTNAWGMKYAENKVAIWTTSREFHFEFPDGRKIAITLPADRMVVSIAPYITRTHPCRNHSPSMCRGELANTPVSVRAVTVDGNVILEEKTTTLANGFVDLWLPRNGISTSLSKFSD